VTASATTQSRIEELPSPLIAYRHDVHKLRGRSHNSASNEFAGLSVNESVPLGADGDASMLSRPSGKPETTLEAHESAFRLRIDTGEPTVERESVAALSERVRDLVTVEDPKVAHAAWLGSDVAAAFHEAIQLPYTSLKYHTLLTAALYRNYREGADFEDLYLVVDDPSEGVRPHRTILHTDAVSLRIDADPRGRPATLLGPKPMRSFADVWSRLPEHPLDADASREHRVLDAQLRRLRSWSTALQYIEDSLDDGGVYS
jgi:hypothetical protein